MKFIPGYEGLYSAEDDGRIYSHKRDKYLTPLLNRDRGYYQIKLSKDNTTITYRVHKLIAITYIPNPENKPVVDHINRIKTDNSITNLRWATLSENAINSNARNELKEKHIGFDNRSYRFELNRNGVRTIKRFKTLEEAVIYRDAYLVQ